MSSKNSASETESEWDFHSAYGEESTVHTSRGFVDSGSECDLFLHPNSQHTSSGKQKGKSKLGKAVLTLENKKTNFTDCCKHCPLLQAQNISNTGEFEVELPPESVLHLYFEDSDTSGHSSKVYSTKIPQSEPDGSKDEFRKIPHVLIADNSVIGETFHSVKKAGFNKLYQKQSSVDYSQSSRHNKAVQVSFPCREREARENFVSECFEQSSRANVKKTSVKKPEFFHSVESQLADDHSYKTDSPQTTEQVCYPTTSGELVISLTLEADYFDTSASLASSVIASEDRVRKEKYQKHDLAFKCKGGQQNQPLKKLHISIVPCPVQVDAGKQKHITPSTKQVECSDTLGAETREFLVVDAKSYEASQSLTKSSKSSYSSFHSNQGLSTHKLRGPCQFFPPTKYIHAYHSPHFCMWSFPDYKTTSASEVKKKHPKASRSVKSVVFTRNKETQKSKQFRHRICRFHQDKALNFDPVNRHSQKAKELSELYYVPLTQATKCYRCPLFDETVNLSAAGRDSEKHLRVRRKPHKRTGGVKVVPRFSFHCLLVPINELERSQYISPVRRKNNLKMQNILNYWLGCTGQSPEKDSKGDVCPTPNNNSKSPHFSVDGRTSTSPHLPNLKNISVPLSPTLPLSNKRSSPPCLQTERSPRALYLLPKDQWQPSATCMQTNRATWSSGTSSSDGRCNRSYFPCENTVKIEGQQKERNKFTNTGVERLYCGTNHMSSGGSTPKKSPVCSCGAMFQCGLFPSEESSEIIKKKTRASPNIRRRTSRTESDRMRSPVGSFNTGGACCASCYHGSPPCSFHNTKGQGPSRNQIIKVASFLENEFSPTNLKEDVRKSKAVKPDESKNVRFPVGSSSLQGCPPQNDGFETLKHYHPECPYCMSAAQEHLIASEDQKGRNNCINRKSIFLVDYGQEIRSQCNCSQEIPLFRIGHIDMHNGNRVAVSTQKKPDCQVCTSSYVYYC